MGMTEIPFARYFNKKAKISATVIEGDRTAEFYSNAPDPRDRTAIDVRAQEVTVAPAPEPPVPAVTMPDGAVAGWYPDTSTAGLMRYWEASI